tara:strand:- start:304 stop:465 length:162 start_codon:yes stop_codon:yes gene_type:complete
MTLGKDILYKYWFLTVCEKYLIDPNIALENTNLINAYNNKNSKQIEKILREEF